MKPKVRTCLVLHGRAEEAARFYVSLIENSLFEGAFRPKPDGVALMVEFSLAGAPYQALNDGPPDRPNGAASISVLTADQAETDRLWNALIADGGAESRCGWLTDRFGVAWQIVPEILPRLLADADRVAGDRAFQAMLGMARINIAELEKAFRGV